MKIFKQSGSAARVIVFLAVLIVCCLTALGSLSAVVALRGWALPFVWVEATSTSTHTVSPTLFKTPSPTVYASLTPIPGQWTDTPTPIPGQATKTPTRIPLQRTIASTVTPVLSSETLTLEPFFQETLTPEADEHLRQVQLKYVAFQVAYRAFNELHQQLNAAPTLVVDENWKTKMVTAINRLELATNKLAAVELPDRNYAVYASYLDQLAAETGFMASAYRKGIDRNDPTSLQIAAVHLQAMDELLIKADREFKAVKSRLATPAFSPAPSSTPTP